MRKLLLATILTGLMTGSVALAIPSSGTITTIQTPGHSFSDGGQFTATVSGYPSFQTFCIEETVFFTPGVPYHYTLTSADHSGHQLTLGTAWLFSQFAAGLLTGGLTMTPTEAGELQAALWYFQGQPTPGGLFAGGSIDNGLPAGDTFTAQAIAALLLLGYADPFAADGGLFDVSIINVSDARTGAEAQDWLVITPHSVPDGGTTAILLGVGLLGIGLASRKFAAVR